MEVDLLTGTATFIFLAALGVNALLLRRGRRDELALQIRIFLLALTVRYAFSLVVYQGGLVSALGDEDSSGWLAGELLHADWNRRHLSWIDLPSVLTEAFHGPHMGFRYMTGALFCVLGAPERLSVAALNCFFGALTVVFIYRTARLLFSPSIAARAGWWACWFPSLVVWSAQTVKEPVVVFLETLALYGCVRLRQQGISARHLALCAATIVLILPFRFYAAYVVGATTLLALLAPALFQQRRRAASLALMLVLLPVVGATVTMAQHEAAFQRLDLDRVQKFRHNVSGADQGSGVVTEDIRTPRGFVLGLAIGAAHLLLAPFPWQFKGGSLRMLLTAPEIFFWWWLFFTGVVPGLRYAVRHRLMDVAPLLLFLAGFGLLYSLMFGNVGLVFRQRAQLLPWLLVFAAVGLDQRARRRGAVRDAAPSGAMLAEVRG
jgi:4-amino-4-deoxy-L-arabinose transferase-like glycosyltransferase